MKKAILLSLLFVACVFTASAQKFALIDMEYILKNIPAYEQANTQLNQASQQYQSEVEAKAKEAETLYKEYQKASASLSAAQKTQREEAIVAKEKEAAELRKKYFGPEGEMAKINGNTLGKNIACVAKWGQCELFTHKSRNPYKKNGLYGAISFIAHRDTQNCASKCPTA